jgi:hypothetical protein
MGVASEWSDFFVASTGASAALTGLLFVAVSINLERILTVAGLPERALETLLLLLGVVVASLMVLIPGQGDETLGSELVATSVVLLVAVATLMRRSLRAQQELRTGRWRAYLSGRVALATVGTLPFLIAGLVLLGGGDGLGWAATGAIGAIVAAVVNAWVLLVEILR